MQKIRIQTPIISIIIPAYNSEKTINRCIDCVLVQSFSDFELLLIDDGSTDSTGLIIDSYCKKIIEYTYFIQRIVGLAVQEIWAYEMPLGNGLLFVDSDDWIDGDYIEQLYKAIPDVDQWKGLVVQGYSRVVKNINYKIETISPTIKGLHSLSKEKDLLNNNKLNIIKFNFTIGKLVSKELIEHHHIHFDEQVSFLEDLLFYLEYIKHIDDFSVSSATGYNYVICNSGSLSYKLYPAEKEYHTYHMLLQKVREIKTIHKLEDAHIDNLMRSAEQYILRVCRSLYYYPYRKQRTLRINYLKQYFYVKSFGK